MNNSIILHLFLQLTEDKYPTMSGMWLQEWCKVAAEDLTEKDHGFTKEILRHMKLCERYYPGVLRDIPELSSLINLYEALALQHNETDVDDFYLSLASTVRKLQSVRTSRKVLLADEL